MTKREFYSDIVDDIRDAINAISDDIIPARQRSEAIDEITDNLLSQLPDQAETLTETDDPVVDDPCSGPCSGSGAALTANPGPCKADSIDGLIDEVIEKAKKKARRRANNSCEGVDCLCSINAIIAVGRCTTQPSGTGSGATVCICSGVARVSGTCKKFALV